MCGIAGIYTAQDLSEDQLRQRSIDMMNCLAHRGPDDSGVYVAARSGLTLGFRRLAILDLSSTGRQPMESASGQYRIIFNGEIYNFRQLRQELRDAGWSFRGTSDTEVLANAFERWGVEATLPRLNGMFAIAAWDEQRSTLFLARDRIGIKPLFVYSEPGFVAFGSELKALLALPEVGTKLNSDSVAAFLRHLYVPAPQSIVDGVSKLLPGHYLRITSPSDRPGMGEPFWGLEQVAIRAREEPILEVSQAKRELMKLVLDATSKRLQADVPVGALLSGGVDSSLVVSAMQDRAPSQVKTYTIGFDVDEHDETAYAAAVAGHLGTDHHELHLTGDDALAVVPDLSEMFDEPFADPSQIPTFLVSRLARGDVTVALSGDGGDELFGGYNRYVYGPSAMRIADRLPLPLREIASASVSAFTVDRWDAIHGWMSGLLPGAVPDRLVGEKLHKLGDLLSAGGDSARYHTLLSAWTDPAEVLRRGTEPLDRIVQVFAEHSSLPMEERMMLADQLQYLPDDLLAKVDRASMAVSLEVRVPLLDHRIIELSWRLPQSMKIRGGTGKWILREILSEYIPRHLVDRQKVGFTVPIAYWLRGPLRSWAEDHLLSEELTTDDLLDSEALGRAWSRFLDGHSDLALALWAVLMLQSWRRRWT